MQPDLRLTKVFDRAFKKGRASLTKQEKKLYLIQFFILEYEMNGLSGYFYNRLPKTKQISSTVDAMREFGLDDLAELLHQAALLFKNYKDPKTPATWSKVLKRYDPKNQLGTIDRKIGNLNNYGMAESNIK
jgi:hypothetical protein